MANTTSTGSVFIVDDDDSVRRGLSRLMRSAGLASQEFSSAEEFLADVESAHDGCILLDITMPRLSGLQLQGELRRRAIHLPVIAVSAHDDADTRNLARHLGARFFFRKPVDAQALLDAIHWVLTPASEEPTP
jgi:FixJ family two-component response regulator